MLIYKNCFRLDVTKSRNNNFIILSNGTIRDTHSSIGYSVFDIKIPKQYNATVYIYYNVVTKLFESKTSEIPLDIIETAFPKLCPIIKVTCNAENITNYSYYNFSNYTFELTPQGSAVVLQNATTSHNEQTTIHNDKIVTSKLLLGIISIYIQDYGEIDLSSVLNIDSDTNTIHLIDNTFGGSVVDVNYITQRL